MYTHFLYSNNTISRGNNWGELSGYPTNTSFRLNQTAYASFQFNGLNLGFSRQNFNKGGILGLNPNVMNFKKNDVFAGRVNITNNRQVNSFVGGLLRDFRNGQNSIDIDGELIAIEAILKEQAKKGERKSFEEIVNLLLNYGERAITIAKNLGILKDSSTTTDETGWTDIPEDPENPSPTSNNPSAKPAQEKELDLDEKKIFGIKQEYVLGGAGVALLTYLVTKK